MNGYPPPFDDPKQVLRALTQQKTICSNAVAEAIFAIGQLRVYQQGDHIAKQGDLGNELFYILSGSVKVVVNEHDYKVRSRNEMIGEMAVIQPGERRSADLIANQDDTVLFAVGATKFLDQADEHGEIWECIARELADRLRQRDHVFVPPNPKPVIFIASSSEGLDILTKAKARLEDPSRVLRPWNSAGIFRPTLGTLEELERHAHEVDFAIIVVTADDLRESRGATKFVPRDNVMLECGLFMGALERERAFLLASVDPDLALASDLDGVTALYFRNDSELTERLDDIEATIERRGRMYRYCKILS